MGARHGMRHLFYITKAIYIYNSRNKPDFHFKTNATGPVSLSRWLDHTNTNEHPKIILQWLFRPQLF